MTSKEKRIRNLLEQVLNEVDTAPGIHIKPDDAMDLDADKLSKIAAKSNVVIGEDDDLTDIATTDTDLDKQAIQQNALYKVQEWTALTGIMLSDPEERHGLLCMSFSTEKGKPIGVFIYPDGTIKISGKVVLSFEDFQKIVSFHNKY